MFSKRPLLSTILLSLFAHGIILLQIPVFRFISQQGKPLQVEIQYIENKKETMKQSAQTPARPKGPKEDLKAGRREPLLKLPSLITAIAAKSAPSPFIDKSESLGNKKELIRQDGGRIFTKPALLKPDIGAAKKKMITLAAPKESDLNKINSPSYIGYFQLTREKVRRILYQRYTYTEEGEVFLSFIVGSNGMVKQVRIDEEKSSPSPYLREIAIASVKESSPFPIFPKDLEYPELSFNVVVSFEVE
jgi:TonB family protein